jgi:hypothetical protein
MLREQLRSGITHVGLALRDPESLAAHWIRGAAPRAELVRLLLGRHASDDLHAEASIVAVLKFNWLSPYLNHEGHKGHEVKSMKRVIVDSTSNATRQTRFCISFVFFVPSVVQQNHSSAIVRLL